METGSRYAVALSQYDALSRDEQAAWLGWLFQKRSEPAARDGLDDTEYRSLVEEHRALIARVRAGQPLSTDELLATLKQVDRQETAAIERLTREYRHVTREAVGTDEWEFQRRMSLCQAIARVCAASPYPFEGQPKVIDWLEAAILQQRLTARPPLPRTPDFYTLDDSAWRTAPRAATAQMRTSFELDSNVLGPARLSSEIDRYNDAMAELVDRLYEPQSLSANQLHDVVCQIATLGLTRVGLASYVLDLAPADRRRLAAIEPLDTAIELARVKVSAARRQILQASNYDTSGPQWDELKSLNDVAQRLDMLASGPDR